LTTQKNTVISEFKSRGAEKVAKDTDNIGRAQTRLGQASASAGRSFSAQASGLGGLVGVYAAAAANVFAITAAFDALGKAAQSEQIIRGTKTLALEIGQNGSRILKSVQEITQAQLTLAESAQNINIALSAGFNTEQIEQLSEVSLKASRALGRNLTDAFQRVVRGASKLEPELLDELGIFTRIDPAVAAYASKLNIAASSLTNYEKRQAFVNAVIEEGQKKFSSIDTSLDSSQKKFEQLRVGLTELALEFGQLVANVLSPIVDFFKNNIGNALLLFGGILSLVFGRAIQAIGGFVGNSLNRLSAFTANLAAGQAAMKSFENQAKSLQGSVSSAKAAEGLKQFQTRIQGQAAGGAEAQLLRDTLDAQEKGQLKTAKAVNEANRVYKSQIALLDKGSARYNVLNALIEQNKVALQGANIQTRILIGLSNLLNVSVRALATAFSLLTGSINVLFFAISAAQLIGSLFDVDVLGEIKKFFKDLSQSTAELKAGITGVVSLVGEGEKLVNTLKNLGATDDDIEDLQETLKSLRDSSLKLVDSGSVLNSVVADSIDILNEQGANIRQNKNEYLELGRQQRFVALLQAQVNKATKDGDLIQAKYYETLLEGQERFGFAQKLIGGVARELGMTGEQAAKNLERFIDVQDDRTIINFAGGIDVTDKRLADLDDNAQKVVTNLALLENTLNKASESFKRGTATSETLSKQLGGARKTLQELIELEAERMGPFSTGTSPVIEEAEKTVAELDKQVRLLKAIEGTTKALDDQFGNLGKTLDTAIAKGLVGISGAAKDSNEVAKNQANFLAEAGGLIGNNVTAIEDALKAQKEGADLDSIQVGLLTNREKALKAIAGLSLQLTQEIEKEVKAREAIKQKLEDQVKTLRLQNELQKLQSDLTLQRAQQETEISRLQLDTVDIAKTQIDISKEIESSLQKQFDLNEKITKEQIKQARLQSDIAGESLTREAMAAEREREAGIARQRDLISSMDQFSNLFTSDQMIEAQRKLIDLELRNGLKIIEERERIATVEFNNRIAALEDEKSATQRQIDETNRQLTVQKQLQDQETQVRQATQAIELQKLANDKTNLASQKTIIQKQEEIELARVAAQRAEFDLANKQSAERIAALRVQADTVAAFSEAVGGRSKFVAAIENFLIAQGRGDLAKNIAETVVKGVDVDFSKLEGFQADIETLQDSIISLTTTGVRDKAQGALDVIDEQLNKNQVITDLTAKRQVLENRLAELANDRANAQLIGDNRLRDETLKTIDLQIAKEEEKFLTTVLNLDQEKQKLIENAALKQADLDRQKNDLMKIKNIAAGVVVDHVTEAFMDFNTALIEGNLTFKNIAQGFRDMVGSMLKEIQAQVFRQTIAKPIADSIGTLFLATGGKVRHMAAGGSAMKRDRVATMLEPGEFVIRKEAAKKLGMSKLQELNAGIGEDKLARVIAYAMGSKVKEKATGGSIYNEDYDPYYKTFGRSRYKSIDDLPPSAFNADGSLNEGGRRALLGLSTASTSRRPQSPYTQRSLDQYGLGSRGFNPLALIPGMSLLSFLTGTDLAGMKGLGYRDAPRPSTQKEAMELEKALAGLEEVYGVRPTRMKGLKIGDIDPSTGGIFGRQGVALENIGNAIFGARTRTGNVSFNSFRSGYNAVFGTGDKPDFAFRRTPLSVAEYNAASPLARAKFNPAAYQAFGGQRAISINQALQLQRYGGYKNDSGGYTIPSGSFSGTIRDVSIPGGDRPDFGGTFQSRDFSNRGGPGMGGNYGGGGDAFDPSGRFAAGGLVRLMAGGGAVNTRDRVPALLEPGEFVIRRPMAKAIGGPALNQMNATGVAPNIAVNVNNQGVPKDVAVSAPRMNGDKVILDIITRDMRNNGAIRKSLRGNR
jgi:exonuclease VII small subunit